MKDRSPVLSCSTSTEIATVAGGERKKEGTVRKTARKTATTRVFLVTVNSFGRQMTSRETSLSWVFFMSLAYQNTNYNFV